jgi:glucose/arabinose dehydrogenase
VVCSVCKSKEIDKVANLYCKTLSLTIVKELIAGIVLLSLIPAAFAQEYPELGVKVETIADNLTIPWSIDWASDEIIFFTERNGNLRAIHGGELLQEPLLSLGVGGVEGGMLGVTVDPDFTENNYIYLYYTYNELISTSNKVVRYQVTDGKVTEDKVLVDGIPGGPFHDGGRIQFGPDRKLYITTGEAGNPSLSQDLNSLGGKILRINSDGTIPNDNPWKDSPVYSIGHRNPQGIDWDESGNLVATEHGPSGWRGSAHDEINLIIPGTNYGWPYIIGDESMEGLQNPLLHTGDDTWAPSGSEFYKGDKIPQWTGKYFVATLRGSHLHMIDFDMNNNKVISHEKLFQDEFGRLRDVATGPDGFLYILTSNQDGRGSPQINDDRILRIVPMNNTINSFKDCVAAGNPIMESYPRQCKTQDDKHFVEEISKIPEWIRKTAKWWSITQISDEDFASGLEYLIKHDIITIPQRTISDGDSEPQLPSWLRKNAGWWSQGLLSDDEFFKSIQWMIDNRFIKI